MEILYRAICIIVELAILIVIVYALLDGIKLAIFDFRVSQKYNGFFNLVMMILASIALAFFFSHLVTFYPRILP